ncbi:carbon-nitrogen hydrolase family protein [Nocardioides caldifontis]|uniref:carbon-nitrogen hydrolase family protein n=1 Tax=Nocardioides caldifontis TaxID=2588938 RepID=UPI0011DF8205|nr:carbon-nitrogen hydrolase family protein [Nocardioides caldifontis]
MASDPTSLRTTVALVQVAASRDPGENRERLAALDVPDAGLVVLPEVFQRDLGKPGDDLAGDAEPLDGPFVDALTAKARAHGGTWIAGMVERSEDPTRPYNTLVVVDPDGLRASYRKIHLYDSFGFKESDRLVAGPRTPTVVDAAGLRVGLMTCYDLRFPELARELSRVGVDLLAVPAAWVAGPRKVAHWRTLTVARAVENVAYVAAVGQPAPRYTGHSMLVDPRGDVVVEAGDGDAEVVVGEVSTALLAEAREENPSLLNRRDDLPWH